ncbi:MAG: hypothetical protein BGP24_23820 [Lysobacterales bacterium 69-70]|nr:hypothetical protein [Xanthomonadaceae bacterium]ODV22515.1 MAG: hypothetical protein ABT27_02160 [Xanthomonadaceae bacterium SCN 69-25]OJY96311.1 MAG: hypothetical protein BGP24_23820 [Xanthomonadales bacterium 69-70]
MWPALPLLRRVSAVALVAAAPLLQAQTLVPNAQMDGSLAPWQQFISLPPDPLGAGTAPAWAATPDIDGNPASGSATIHISTGTPTTNASSGISQCFDFSQPTAVNFVNYGMAFRVPATTARDGSVSATVEVRLYSGTGCSGFLAGGSQGQALTSANVPADTWYRLSDVNFVPAAAPVTAASAQIRGYLRQTGAAPGQTDYPISLDRFVLVLNSTTPVSLLRFDVE